MRHLLMAHQQECFLPFSPWQSLSCCLSHVAKRSTTKPRGPLYSPSQPLGPLPHFRTTWPSPSMAAAPGVKSQRPSSSAVSFPTPPTINYTCQHSLFFQLYWATVVNLGRRGPMAWSQSSPSSHAGPVTRGSCFPVPSWVEFTPIPLAQSMPTAI